MLKRIQALRREVYDRDDYQEGMRAFFEKRPPDFRGREPAGDLNPAGRHRCGAGSRARAADRYRVLDAQLSEHLGRHSNVDRLPEDHHEGRAKALGHD